jgi:myo-inositol catabolism protein IolS
MKYRNLKRVNLSLSELGLGTWAIGGVYWTDNQSTGWAGSLDEKDIIAAIRTAIEAGVNHIDTADVYGYGKSERLIGRAIKGIPRKKLVLASKVGWIKTSAASPFTPQNIRYQCEQSLRNLQTDYLDIYYFHHCDFGPNDCFLAEAIAAMEALRAEGKIRCVGLSGYSEGELLRVGKVLKPAVIQSWADIEHDEFIRNGSKLRRFMDSNEIMFVPMMPYAQGRLLGKYKHDAPPQFEDGDNRKGSAAFTSESLKELKPRLTALKKRFGSSVENLAHTALQFLLANDSVVSVIPGFRNSNQVRVNIEAAKGPLRKEDMEYILKIFPRKDMKPHPWSG